jgi:Mrp family chromosome partitioning ATPase
MTEMGRTFEVLGGGRIRKVVGGEDIASIPFPTAEAEPALPILELVPAAEDDLPSDDNDVPFIEVGKGKPAVSIPGPQLLPPRPKPIPAAAAANQPSIPEVAFLLLRDIDQLPVTAKSLGQELIAYHNPAHPVSRQYRSLVDGISAQLPANQPAVLFLTPISTSVAATTTALNLAITRASDGQGRVLVIELEAHTSSKATGVPGMPGWRELLARTAPMTISLHRTGVDGLFLLPAGKVEVGSEELARLPSLIEQLRARFDWILIDAPTWGTHPLNEWVKRSDGAYLVLKQEEWAAPQAELAHEGITQTGGKLRGCITSQS